MDLAIGFVVAAGDEPAAREGNLRTVCCAALDPDAPIVKCLVNQLESFGLVAANSKLALRFWKLVCVVIVAPDQPDAC
jgi:hypothetical protein